MTFIVRRVVSIAVLAMPLPLVAHAQSALAPSAVRAIDSVFAAYDSRVSPGCAAAVVRDGRPIFEKGYGMSDLQHGVPITPASIFHVASISKQFTAMAMVLLARDGKLSLDDDIRKHLPEVPDFGHRITIRHLIHHTSGLRDQWQLLSLSGWRPDDPKSEADILWLVGRQRALNFVPGSEHLYSNTGYTLMGTIVQRVTGKTLRQFTTERIFAPLGMTSTHFHDDHTMIVPGRTSAYQLRPGRAAATAGVDDYAISIPVFDNAGATSLFTTVQDMAKWEANFLQPQVGDTAVLRQMYERGRLTDGRNIPYAFALTHGQIRGLNTIGHGGADAGYRADFLRLPDQRHAFIAMCNIASANPSALTRSMAEVVLGDRMTAVQAAAAAAAAPPVAKPIDAALVRALAGPYLDPKTEELRTVLYRENTNMLYPNNNPNTPGLVHVGDSVFALTSPTGQVSRLRITTDGMVDLATSTTFKRMPPAVTAREKLAEFVGRYCSEELDVEWTIAQNDQGALTLARRRVSAQPMMPAFADGFNSQPGSIRFTRDANGRVTGFLLTSGRIRHVRFDRTQ
jgi:CubicO group peptidase (beta-lactamase class C family)